MYVVKSPVRIVAHYSPTIKASDALNTNPRSRQYLTHAHSHITGAVAAKDSCFGLVRPHQPLMAQPSGRNRTCTRLGSKGQTAVHMRKVLARPWVGVECVTCFHCHYSPTQSLINSPWHCSFVLNTYDVKSLPLDHLMSLAVMSLALILCPYYSSYVLSTDHLSLAFILCSQH